MTAKEMFGELGYKKTCDNCNIIKYDKTIDYYHIVCTFYIETNCFEKMAFVDELFEEFAPIRSNELKAINKQCEELGWLDE